MEAVQCSAMMRRWKCYSNGSDSYVITIRSHSPQQRDNKKPPNEMTSFLLASQTRLHFLAHLRLLGYVIISK